jgi:hypothetical protein
VNIGIELNLIARASFKPNCTKNYVVIAVRLVLAPGEVVGMGLIAPDVLIVILIHVQANPDTCCQCYKTFYHPSLSIISSYYNMGG